MTRKEKEEKILELFDLKVGDRILVKSNFSPYNNKILEIKDFDDHFIFREINRKTVDFNILILIDSNWEKVEKSLKDKKCGDFKNCESCPFHNLTCFECGYVVDYEEKTMSEIYDEMKEELDILKQRIFGDEK